MEISSFDKVYYSSKDEEDQPQLERWHSNIEGLLDPIDAKKLREGAKELIHLFQELKENDQMPKTLIFPTKGARELRYFVRGLLDGIGVDYENQPKSAFVQFSQYGIESEATASSEAFNTRMDTLVKNSQPPFLIIDDYVSTHAVTITSIRQALMQRNVDEQDIKAFAFLAETLDHRNELIPVDTSIYDEMNIRYGVPDPYGSSHGFMFRGKTKLTEKNLEKPYENATKAPRDELEHNIRYNLYRFGKDIAKGKEFEFTSKF